MFLPGKVHGQRSLAGYSPWGHAELDMTERLSAPPPTHSQVTALWQFQVDTHIWVSFLTPQTPLPSRLLQSIEQSSLCCTEGPCLPHACVGAKVGHQQVTPVSGRPPGRGPCWLPTWNMTVCMCWSKAPRKPIIFMYLPERILQMASSGSLPLHKRIYIGIHTDTDTHTHTHTHGRGGTETIG